MVIFFSTDNLVKCKRHNYFKFMKELSEKIQIKDAEFYVGEKDNITYLCFVTKDGLYTQRHAINLKPSTILHYVNKHKHKDVEFFKTSQISDNCPIGNVVRERLDLMYAIELENYNYPEPCVHELESLFIKYLTYDISEDEWINRTFEIGQRWILNFDVEEFEMFVCEIFDLINNAMETLSVEDDKC